MHMKTKRWNGQSKNIVISSGIIIVRTGFLFRQTLKEIDKI